MYMVLGIRFLRGGLHQIHWLGKKWSNFPYRRSDGGEVSDSRANSLPMDQTYSGQRSIPVTSQNSVAAPSESSRGLQEVTARCGSSGSSSRFISYGKRINIKSIK
nr:hypothetical protein [Tanacetum cinerariifolium]